MLLLFFYRLCDPRDLSVLTHLFPTRRSSDLIGTFSHTVHRTLIHLRVTALGRDEDLILEEAEGDENEVEGRLATAIAEDTPPEIHALLERQYREAQRHHGEIREWQQRAQLH